MNRSTPRLFIAATRMNDGKTTTSLGLLSALQRVYADIGFIKPVGQRFIEVDEQKIDEDSFLMDKVYRLNCPLVDMSPIAVEPDFTRKYLQSANNEDLIRKIREAFDRVAQNKAFVLCEGTGHAGVGSVFDLSNAQVAKILGAKVVIVTQGGIGKPIDEVALNQALFAKEGVEVVGVILNKVITGKVDYVTDFARRGLQRKGLELLGVVPHHRILSSPTLASIRDELEAEQLNGTTGLHNMVDDVVVGAMAAHNALNFFKPGVLIITPGDREDIILAAATSHLGEGGKGLAGIVLTGNLRPSPNVLQVVQKMPYPVLLATEDSYQVASKVHNMIVKTRPDDSEKIALIRDMIAAHVDLEKILNAL